MLTLIICPHCDMRISLPSHMLGTKGRKFKCSRCREVFFQKSFNQETSDATPVTEVTVPCENSLTVQNSVAGEKLTPPPNSEMQDGLPLLLTLEPVRENAVEKMPPSIPNNPGQGPERPAQPKKRWVFKPTGPPVRLPSTGKPSSLPEQ